jgi:uncharacterized protein involved in exopolysaccharide biosynthesis
MSSNHNSSQDAGTLTSESHRDVAQAPAGLSVAQSQQPDLPEGTPGFDVLLVLARKKWHVLGGTVLGGVVAGVIAFLTPNIYTANAVLMVPPQSQSSASLLLGQLGGLAGMAGGGSAFGMKSAGDVYIGILGSRTVEDAVIDKLGLLHVYGVKTRMAARAKLAAHSKFSTGKDSLIRIEVRDGDAKRAADIANGYVSALNAKNTEMAVNDALQKRLFLENRLKEEKGALADAEDSMKNQQQKSGLMEVGGQAHVAIEAVVQLQARLMAQEVMLQRIRLAATPQNAEVIDAEAEISGLRAQLKKLEASDAAQSSGDPLVPLSRMPSESLAYLRQFRELKFHEFLFELLTKQYEAARLDESKQAPELPVVDWAIPPEKKSGPSRRLIVLEGFTGAAIFSGALVWLWDSLQRGGEGEKVRRFKRALFG